MGDSCCPQFSEQELKDRKYRRVLWIALGINATMFMVEMVAGVSAGSTSLQADALDFLGDAANYGISLFVATKVLRTRAIAALVKSGSMALFGVWVLASAIWHAMSGTVPHAETMGIIGFLALAANLTVLWLLWAYKTGDSNMRSVWLCSRNDVIGNMAVMLAAVGVFGTQQSWPDLIVAIIMALLALQGARQIILQAKKEIID